MRNLFNFIFKNVHWLLFFALVYFAIFLLVHNNQFQRSKYLMIAKEVTGKFYSVTNSYQSYFNLRSTNTDLVRCISELENTVHAYRTTLAAIDNFTRTTQLKIDSTSTLIYRFELAHVVNNSISKLENYMTLDKGSNDGIKENMGVMTAQGEVIGVVTHTSPHFSTVISVLNPKFRLSGKIKQNNYSGPLVWTGGNSQYTYLTELPRHAEFEIGDTIVTSGYSAVFPKGLPIGTIVSNQRQHDDNYNSVKIKLFADVSNLNEVLVVQNSYQQEQQTLENNIPQ